MEELTGTENDEIVVLTKKHDMSLNIIIMIIMLGIGFDAVTELAVALFQNNRAVGVASIHRCLSALVMFFLAKFLPEIDAPKQWKVAKKHLVEVKNEKET